MQLVKKEHVLAQTVKVRTISSYVNTCIIIHPFCDAACRPPDAIVGFEFSEYRVQENMRSRGFALQICATSTNLHIPVQVTLEISSHTAERTYT